MSKNILVLGIGNILLKDEGAGIHVVTQLQNEGFDGADLTDGGTGGFHLLGLIQSYNHVIIPDASIDDFPAGHVRVLKPEYAKDFPDHLSAHELGLKDLIDAAYMLGNIPEIYVVAISVRDFREMGIGLTPDIEKAIPVAAGKIRELVRSFND